MILGLCGFIGSGKGTVGDILRDHHGFIQDSFARPLKDAVATIFGWDRTLLEGATPESRAWREQPDSFWSAHFGKPFTPRLALQLMGTEAGRNVFHPEIRTSSLLYRNHNTGKNVVVTDVRFKNEIKAIQDAGGYIIRVERGPNPEWYTTALHANRPDLVGEYDSSICRREMEESEIHQSEWDWIGSTMDYTIDNNGNIDRLLPKINDILTSIAQ
jgi:hypothetical protein